MNLSKLIEKQSELLEHIVTEKQLLETDLIKDTFLALQVELAEFANEGRWFKYWSENRAPNETSMKLVSYEVNGELINKPEPYNPLLEEYVDSFHFFLQVAILMEWEDALWIYEEQLDPNEFDGDLSGWYLELTYFLNKSFFENPNEEQSQIYESHFGFPEKQHHFRTAWILFLNLGMNGFGFTWNRICDAYLDKNKVNHERQANGY